MNQKSPHLYGVLSAPLDRAEGSVILVPSSPDRTTSDAGNGLKTVTAIARAMDSAFEIPGTKIRFGFDSLIGLIPGAGDVAAALLAVFILSEGRRLGVSRLTMARMATNVAIDAVGGAIPIIGDAFDVYWKSNQRNVALLERHRADGDTARLATRSDLAFFVAVAIAMIVAVACGVWLTITILGWLYRELFR